MELCVVAIFSGRQIHSKPVGYPLGSLALRERRKTCSLAYRLTAGKLPQSGDIPQPPRRGLIRDVALVCYYSGDRKGKGSRYCWSCAQPDEFSTRQGLARHSFALNLIEIKLMDGRRTKT